MKPQAQAALTAAALLLSACGPGTFDVLEPDNVVARNAAPPGAAPGTCWGQDETPAVIETVTEQVVEQQEGEGAVYTTQTQQRIIKPREDKWFETPCDEEWTPEFTSTVQRALKARGHYWGPISGRVDGRTRAAIRAYQKPQGLDSGKLSLAAARQMGLVTIDTKPFEAQPETQVAAVDPAVAEAKARKQAEADKAARDRAESKELARQQAAYQAEQKKAAREDAQRLKREEAERAKEAKELARQEAAYKAEQEKAAKAAEAQRAQQEEDRAVQAQQAAKAKRAKELEQALAEEKARNGGSITKLPISSESF